MTDTEKSIREIRINPIVPSESVLVATARSMRPKKAEEPLPRDTRERVDTCPFCRGNEGMTPPAIAVYPEAGDWDIRIVQNLYPVLGDDRENPTVAFGLQQTIDGYGRHEVIIDHHSHGMAVKEMSDAHLTLLFSVYRDRMEQIYESNKRLHYVFVFKNYGPAAGASIAHTHSQIIAMPVVPDNVQDEVENSRRFYQKNRRCIFCALIDEALTFEATLYDRESGEIRRKIDVGQFVVERGKKFIAIKPFASRFEWEIHILPLVHQSDFLNAAPDDIKDLARVMRRTMARLDAVLGNAQYNYFLHSLPHADRDEQDAQVPRAQGRAGAADEQDVQVSRAHDTRDGRGRVASETKTAGRAGAAADCDASYHWHIEICPRTSIPSGFELGSGLFVNTISPETAAARLRAAQID